jgi:hypothetical protein
MKPWLSAFLEEKGVTEKGVTDGTITSHLGLKDRRGVPRALRASVRLSLAHVSSPVGCAQNM